tara:strand:- start:584 stop:1210 length:627 start_codon:yes stop_codon:yes gene_type:complete
VYASSSSIYGGLESVPYREDVSADQPISLYAATKRANELMAHTYSHLFGLETIGLRFFTAYGPWGRPDMAYWSFAEKILAGHPIPVFNHGNMKRDFTYIDDIVDGVISAMVVENIGPYALFNLGNSRSENLMDFIALLEKHFQRSVEKEFLAMQPGDMVHTYADIEKATKLLNFSPKTPLDRGLKAFADWFLDHPDLLEAIDKDKKTN